MSPFAKIGKTSLKQLLGLQKNWTETIEDSREVIDIDASGCEACKWYKIKSVTRPDEPMYSVCESTCANCPCRKMKTEYTYKQVYHNEKNRYGYKPVLKTNAIKLFLAYHFYNIDNIGFIQNVNLQELANSFGCNIKTIHNNNELLRKYGYISFSKTDTNTVNIFLPEYENYFKPLSQGGKGFLIMSTEVLQQVLAIKSINELRICLRRLMEFDLLTNSNVNNVEKSYAELRRDLPGYCKRNVIQKASEKLALFVVEMKDNLIKFIIKPEYDAKLQKEEQEAFYEEQITEFAKEFANDVSNINTSICDYKSSKYAEFFEGTEAGDLKCWFFTAVEIADLASLCLQYSWHTVLKALQNIYKTYRLTGTKIRNLGGLTRSIILANATA